MLSLFSSEFLKQSLVNLKGKKINDKLIIVESDDWGTIRMSSKRTFEALKKKGYPVDQCPYNSNDALESNEDLVQLFEVLNSVKGNDGKPAILTANNIVANPDFDKIKASGFQEYFYEPFSETLKKYPCHDKVMYLYELGISEGVIMPQFHGREHVHVLHWLGALNNKDKIALDTFEHQMFSVFLGQSSNCYKEFLNAMASYSQEDLDYNKKSVNEGLQVFSSIWGFESKSIIAPCYNWHRKLEETFASNGVEIIQGGRAQLEPVIGTNYNRPIRHYIGQKNKYKQSYTIRNVIFEPSTNLSKDWVSSAMSEISSAFFWRQPAIISSHRLNYTGWLNEKNRSNNLRLLKNLLKQIVKRWPDVKFVSSDQLVKYYS